MIYETLIFQHILILCSTRLSKGAAQAPHKYFGEIFSSCNYFSGNCTASDTSLYTRTICYILRIYTAHECSQNVESLDGIPKVLY